MARHSTKVRVRSREAPMVDAICWVAAAARGASYEVLCAAAASPRKAVRGAFYWGVVCLCERPTPGVNRNSCGLVKECFLRFLYSYGDRKRRSIVFFAPAAAFPSVLLTLASLHFCTPPLGAADGRNCSHDSWILA